jgi:hypothetical protein
VHTEIKNEQDLIGPGAAVGAVPTDLEQATGLERLEILGKMQGIDIFDMKPLDASRKGARRITPPPGARPLLTAESRHAGQPHHRQVLRG